MQAVSTQVQSNIGSNVVTQVITTSNVTATNVTVSNALTVVGGLTMTPYANVSLQEGGVLTWGDGYWEASGFSNGSFYLRNPTSDPFGLSIDKFNNVWVPKLNNAQLTAASGAATWASNAASFGSNAAAAALPSTGGTLAGALTVNGALVVASNVTFGTSTGRDYILRTPGQGIYWANYTGAPTFYNSVYGVGSNGSLGDHVFYTGGIGGTSNGSERLRITSGGDTVVSGRLYFPNALADRRLVFWQTADNGNQFYGMGLQSGKLRFQVDNPGGVFSFQAGTSAAGSQEALRVDGAGNVTALGYVNASSVKTRTLDMQAMGAAYTLDGSAAQFTLWNTAHNVSTIVATNATQVQFPNPRGLPGAVLVGTTTTIDSDAVLQVKGIAGQSSAIGTSLGSTALSYHVRFNNPNGLVGWIQTANSVTGYQSASDHRLKENVVGMSNACKRLARLRPVTFNFKCAPEQVVDGFIAHEVQEVVPEAASGVKDEVDAKGQPVYQGVDCAKLVPLLTAALQEHDAQLAALRGEVASLRAALGACPTSTSPCSLALLQVA